MDIELTNSAPTELYLDGGLRGASGLSAYELWLQAGNSGTIEDFLDSLGAQDATSLVKGIIKLTNDLGGTADLPKVRGTNVIYVAPSGDTRPANYRCTGSTGHNVTIQAAIDYASSLPQGGTVELLSGTYVISQYLLPKNNVWLRGENMFNTTLAIQSGVADEIIDFHNHGGYTYSNPLTNFWCTDLEFDSSGLPSASGMKAIDGINYKDCRFQRLYVHDCGASGIGIDFPINSIISDNLVVNCGYTGKNPITNVSYSTNTYTFTTQNPHGYAAGSYASSILTASGTPADGDTVTVHQLTYTFKTTLTGASYEVAIGADAASALTNLKAAINVSGGAGTAYGVGTVINPKVRGQTITSTTLEMRAVDQGTGANAFVTTETGANLSFNTATLTGGTVAKKVLISGMVPELWNGIFSVTSVTDPNTFTVSTSNNPLVIHLGINPGIPTVYGMSSDGSSLGHNGIGIGANESYNEGLICTNNIVIGSQNNNYLIENDTNNDRKFNTSYIFSNNISLNAGQYGYRNTGCQNAQFNNCYDYGSLNGGIAFTTISTVAITNATWSAGVTTYTTATDHGYTVGQQIVISDMIPTAYNGGYMAVASTPTSTTFTVAMASDPGTAILYGTAGYVKFPIDGSSFTNCIFYKNVVYGLLLSGYADGVLMDNLVIKDCYNFGLSMTGSYNQIKGSRIFNNGRAGIRLISSSVPLEQNILSNLQIYNNGKYYTADAIDFDGNSKTSIQDITINNVHAFDNQTIKTQRYGIIFRSDGAINRVSVNGGDLSGNVTAPIAIQSTSQTISFSNVTGLNPNARAALGNITGSVTFDSTASNNFSGTLTGNVTAVMPDSLIDGTTIKMLLKQNGTGGYTFTPPANATTLGASLKLSTAANASDMLVWVWSALLAKWVLQSNNLTSPQPYTPRVNTLASVSATFTPNADTTDIGVINAPGATFTVGAPTGTPVNGQKLQIRIIITTARTPIWNAIYTAKVGHALPTTLLPASTTYNYHFEYDSTATTWVLYDMDYELSMAPMTTQGDIIYGGSNGVGTRLAAGTTSQVLTGGTSPAWGAVALASMVSGTLPVASGGTGVTSSTGTGNTVLSASPALTGIPTAPTATSGTNTTQLATTAFVTSAVSTYTAPDATTGSKGIVQLAGDLGGTAASPTTPTAVHITGTETIAGDKTLSGSTTLGTTSVTDASNIGLGTTTGTKIGTATTQKLGFFNATPVVQQTATADLGTLLATLGLRASGGTYTLATSGSIKFDGNQQFTYALTRTTAVTLGLASSRYNICDASGGAFTITLPATASSGITFSFKKIDSSGNAVTIAGTIDGAVNYTLATQYKYVHVMSTTTSGTWYVWENN